MRFLVTTCTLAAAFVALVLAGLQWAGAGYVPVQLRLALPQVERLEPGARSVRPSNRASVRSESPVLPWVLAAAGGLGIVVAGLVTFGAAARICLPLLLVLALLLLGAYLVGQRASLLGIAVGLQGLGVFSCGILWRRTSGRTAVSRPEKEGT